ncbi:MAG: hypothetical protein WC486_00200 [Candidatus Omnitrophota bacterium]
MPPICAIDPSEIVEVEVLGIKFQVGVIPFRRFNEIQNRVAVINKENLVSAGPEKQAELLNVLINDTLIEYVRWGIKGHSGLSFKNGKEVPFVTAKEKVGGKEYDVVAEETLQVYNSIGIMAQLAEVVVKSNKLSDAEKKAFESTVP